MTDDYRVIALDAAGVRAGADDLAAVLVDCVEGGASVNFMAGFDTARALAFWRDIATRMESDGRHVFAAAAPDGVIVGTVQLVPAGIENQPHRAEISKMLVLRSARKRGLGGALMRAAEGAAARTGRTLLNLDTASDDAERLYSALGWTLAGRIPNYALMPDGTPCATALYYKQIVAAQ